MAFREIQLPAAGSGGDSGEPSPINKDDDGEVFVPYSINMK